jgi:hypothetical protein
MAHAQAGIFIAISLAITVVLLIALAAWGRRRSKGAVLTGALLSIFAPDPTLEAQVRLAEASRQTQSEEDEEGEPQ